MVFPFKGVCQLHWRLSHGFSHPPEIKLCGQDQKVPFYLRVGQMLRPHTSLGEVDWPSYAGLRPVRVHHFGWPKGSEYSTSRP